jgi:hypothetical protein
MRLYIDPSAVTYVIPAIAGVAVVVGSWLFLHFRRAKSKVSKKLGIDENAGKEVEEDIVIKEEEKAEEKPSDTDKVQ